MAADNNEIDQRIDQINRDASQEGRRPHPAAAPLGEGARQQPRNQFASDISKTTSQATTRPRGCSRRRSSPVRWSVIQALIGVIETRIQTVSLEGESLGSVHLFSSALPPGRPSQAQDNAIAYAAVVIVAQRSSPASSSPSFRQARPARLYQPRRPPPGWLPAHRPAPQQHRVSLRHSERVLPAARRRPGSGPSPHRRTHLRLPFGRTPRARARSSNGSVPNSPRTDSAFS